MTIQNACRIGGGFAIGAGGVGYLVSSIFEGDSSSENVNVDVFHLVASYSKNVSKGCIGLGIALMAGPTMTPAIARIAPQCFKNNK